MTSTCGLRPCHTTRLNSTGNPVELSWGLVLLCGIVLRQLGWVLHDVKDVQDVRLGRRVVGGLPMPRYMIQFVGLGLSCGKVGFVS